MSVSTGVWVATLILLCAILLADLLVIARRPHKPSMRESLLWVSLYVGLAIAFGVSLLFFTEARYSGEFFAGWVTEYSLSVDNLFIFVLIMRSFSVPSAVQQKVLMVGIVLALVMRGVFIALGAAAIHRFSWIFYIFGAFLIFTAVKLVKHGAESEDEQYEENIVIRTFRRMLPISEKYDGAKVRTFENGRWIFTPLIIVMLAIGTTDLIFALDSIPAIFGLTKEPYLVFTANVFALMGLRQLYFLLGGLLDRLVYLSIGLAIVLGFIGVKLVLEALHENNLPFINGGEPVSAIPDIPILVSLGFILVTLTVTAVASILKSRHDERAKNEPLPLIGTLV